jgi:hypothetical protein
MASFSDLGTIASSASWVSRVQYAVMVAAVQVYAEDPNTPGHPARIAFAKAVINGVGNSAPAAVLTNPSIAAEANVQAAPGYGIPDGDIQFTVNSLWNALAGA